MANWENYYNAHANRKPNEQVVRAAALCREREEALDLGAGTLIESKFLLDNGFKKVTAIDSSEGVRTFAEGLDPQRRIVNGGKAIIVDYGKFTELMENMPQIIRPIRNLAELDQILKKIYTNFTVEGKNVVNATLASPFDAISTLKITPGALGRNRTYITSSARMRPIH